MKKIFSTKRFLKKLWSLLDGLHRQIVFLLILTVLTEILLLIGPYILKIIVDLLANFRPELIRKMIIWGGLMFLVGQTGSLFIYFQDRKIFDILIKAEGGLMKKSFRKMVFLSLNYHERENTGNKVLKIERGIRKINELLGNFFWDVAPTIFQLILTTGLLFWVDWRFGLVVLIFVPAFLFITYRTNKKVYPFRKKRYDEEEKASGIMVQSIININTVKSFVQEEREAERYGKLTDSIMGAVWKEFGKILKSNIGRNLVIDSGRFAILLLGIYLAVRSEITIGSLVFVFTISEKSLISLYRISRLYDKLMESGEAVEKLYDLFKETPDIVNKENGIKPEKIEGRIEFKKIDFIYKESGIKALSKVNLKIDSGSRVALVGPSGGGKTTIARMIYRHYDPCKGAVLLDGKDLRDYDLYSFRKFIAIVPQEAEIFNLSIKENIAYGRPEAAMEEIERAAKIANAEEFIRKTAGGYETLVGERGLKLSGGQRQRLGIARAVLADPKILIFDEATSNLDSQSEKLIQDAMEKISRGRTVIIIAHRLSTIKKADKIIVLENGKIVEEGTHRELASIQSGLYKKLVDLQKVGDVDED